MERIYKFQRNKLFYLYLSAVFLTFILTIFNTLNGFQNRYETLISIIGLSYLLSKGLKSIPWRLKGNTERKTSVWSGTLLYILFYTQILFFLSNKFNLSNFVLFINLIYFITIVIFHFKLSEKFISKVFEHGGLHWREWMKRE